MEDISKIFIEEGFELVSNLETHLMDLETNGVSEEIINGVFRVMHSLKGGSSMFGFNKLDELTHNLETIYNKVREDNSNLNQSIIDITFKSVDLIKELLSLDIKAEVEEKTDSLIIELLNIINDLDNSKTNNKKQKKLSVKKDTYNSYYILFNPEQEILSNGTNPLYIIEELLDLSDDYYVISRNKNIPVLEDFNVELCYVSWELIVYTKASLEDLQSVFIFVEDESKIIIKDFSSENVLLYPGIKKYIEKLSQENDFLDYTSIVNNNNNNIKKTNKTVEKKTLVEKIESLKKETPKTKTKRNSISSIKVSSLKLDELMNMVSELVTTQARLHLFAEQYENIDLSAISEDITKITRRLRDNAFSIILIPIESILVKFKRLVRDLSIELNKNIKFVTEGTETELDKTIIESINEPLLHLIRNSIDHGIESKEERKKLGKPEQGIIKLKSFYSGANVHLQISDDGAGIDLKRIQEKAINKGIITKDAKLNDKELLELIWLPGFSTVEVVSDVSGRGVGMDVVRKKISSVRGEIEVETKKNIGTTFTLKLPLTLSIIDGLLVQVADTKYIIQLSVIDKIHKIEHSVFSESFNDIIVLDGEQVPYVYLRNDFKIQTEPLSSEHVVIVEYEDKKIGIIVDDVLGEYQAVLKPLGKHYREVEIFSGGTILGDGSIALVLDTNKIVREQKHKI